MKLQSVTFVSKLIFRNFHVTPLKPCLISEESYQEFRNSIPEIVSKSVENVKFPKIKEKLTTIAKSGVDMQDSFRAPLALLAYKHFVKPGPMSEDSLAKMQTLAWGCDAVRSYFKILSRGNQHSEVDASLLRSLLYDVLGKNFVGYPALKDVVQIFNKAFFHTSIGLQLDRITEQTKADGYRRFTEDRYYKIVEYKMTCAAIKLPVTLAMILANKDDDSMLLVEDICTDIGKISQIQDDYLNCFGGVDVTSLNSAIRAGRCTWLATKALQRCTTAQRRVFIACYGSCEPAHIERIKRLYDQLRIEDLVREQRDVMRNEIQAKAKRLANDNISPEPFLILLQSI